MNAKNPVHLREILGDVDKNAPDNDEDGLPSRAEGEYRPYGMPANKPLVSLHLIAPDGNVRSFQYRHLDSDTRFEHGKIVLRFLGLRPIMVVIEGQQLWRLYDYIHRNRTPWIMQAARDFPEPGNPFVSAITFIDLIDIK